MKQHLLIVDDEEPIRRLLTDYFVKRGYDVTTAATAMEAETFTNGQPFDLVILDLLLPDDDGINLLSRIKANHRDLPVIMLTGIGVDEELFQEAQQMGAFSFAGKSLPLDQLLAKVHEALKGVAPQPQ